MKKEELEKKIKGLEELIKAQRGTIEKLTEQKKEAINKELIESKKNEHKEVIVRVSSLIECCDEYSSCDINELKKEFSVYVTDNELETIKYFINTFNNELQEVIDIDLYRQVLD